MRVITDEERVDFIASQVQEHGPELFAVDGPSKVCGTDYWSWSPGSKCFRGATFREAIDNAILDKSAEL